MLKTSIMHINEFGLEPNPRPVVFKQEQDDLFVSIEIGNGQIGGSKITEGDKILAKGNLKEPVFIGKAVDLNNKEIAIETNVLDVNLFTNVCVIKTTIRNQENKLVFSKIDKGDAPENGVACFKGKYYFSIVVSFLMFLGVFKSNLPQATQDLSFKNTETTSSSVLVVKKSAAQVIESNISIQDLELTNKSINH